MGLIEADKLNDMKFKSVSERTDLTMTVDYMFGWNGAIDHIKANSPTVDAEPIKHGRWWRVPLEIADPNHHYVFMSYKCSECKHAFDQKTPYCPWCGAKMEKRKQ